MSACANSNVSAQNRPSIIRMSFWTWVARNEIICGYCSTLYKFDPALKADESRPADALYHEDPLAIAGHG